MLSLNDLARAFYLKSLGITDSATNPPTPGGGLNVTYVPFEANSLSANGSTTVDHTPGLVFVTLAAPPAGLYKIWLQVASAGGTIQPTDVRNYEFRVGSTPVLKPLAGLADSIGILEAQYRFNGTDNCTLMCVASGSAGARVSGSITVTKIAN